MVPDLNPSLWCRWTKHPSEIQIFFFIFFFLDSLSFVLQKDKTGRGTHAQIAVLAVEAQDLSLTSAVNRRVSVFWFCSNFSVSVCLLFLCLNCLDLAMGLSLAESLVLKMCNITRKG